MTAEGVSVSYSLHARVVAYWQFYQTHYYWLKNFICNNISVVDNTCLSDEAWFFLRGCQEPEKSMRVTASLVVVVVKLPYFPCICWGHKCNIL